MGGESVVRIKPLNGSPKERKKGVQRYTGAKRSLIKNTQPAKTGVERLESNGLKNKRPSGRDNNKLLMQKAELSFGRRSG